MVNRLFSRVMVAACLASGILGVGAAWGAEPGKMTIEVGKPGARISPMLYGLMTEEINYSYDGGLYGELVQNRIFQNTIAPGGRGGGRGRGATVPATLAATSPATATAPAAILPTASALGSLAHWSVYKAGGGEGKIALDGEKPVNAGALKTSLRLDITGGGGEVGVANDGFWGIPVRANTEYKASFYARVGNGYAGPLTVSIVGDDGTVYATARTEVQGAEWKLNKLVLKTGQAPTTAAAKFVVSGGTPGSVWVSLVSLFPPTFHNRPNGFRIDLMTLLDEMRPAYLRFPGGNYVEGQTFADRYDWKKTIGNYSERPGHNSPWRYRSSDGMGLLEFLEWCEDLKMEPVLALFAGYTLDRQVVAPQDYAIYAKEALEEIEYVTGDVTTEWGARRAKDGHPAPFKLTYVEVGNEDNLGNGMQTYDARFAVFYDAIKGKYPNLKIISSAGNRPLQTRQPDLQDEHHYPSSVNASLALANSFDNRPRTGPKVFVGEWATRIGNPTPNFSAAMCDAAFMCGVERNADFVEMFCYAPLLVNVNPGGMQWPSDMIGYNTLTSFGSPAYYVERMFFPNKGDVVLPIKVEPQTPATQPSNPNSRQPLYASSSREDATGDVIVKVVNAGETAQEMHLSFAGAPMIGAKATGEILTGAATDVNTIAEPMKCVPQPIVITTAGPEFTYTFPATSVSVIRFKTK